MSPLRSISDQLAIHSRTPHLTVAEPRGLTVRSIDYHRREPGTRAEARVHLNALDDKAQVTARWDPRQFAHYQCRHRRHTQSAKPVQPFW